MWPVDEPVAWRVCLVEWSFDSPVDSHAVPCVQLSSALLAYLSACVRYMCRLLCVRSPGVVVEVLPDGGKLRVRLDMQLREVSLPSRLAALAVVNRPAQPDSVLTPPPLSVITPPPPATPYPLVSHQPTPLPTMTLPSP